MSRLLAIAALLAALAVACGGDGATPAPGATSPAAAETKPSAAPTATPPAGGGQTTDEPVAFETTDGVTVRGHLYTTPGPKRRVVVLAHEFPKDQTAWRDYARELAAAGIAALTLDFRGYGETGGAREIAKIDLDLDAAVRFVKSRDYPLVYVIGASMGGTAALKVAARQDLAGVVTISSPSSIMGLDARSDLGNIREPKLFIAGGRDSAGSYVRVITDEFLPSSPDPKSSRIFEDASEHGTDLLRSAVGATLRQLLIDFLTR